MPLNVKKLNPKQQAFADFYIEVGNAYQAAVKAGYSDAYAKGNVVKLLENVSVKTYIEKRMKELKSERVADQQEILELLTSVARGQAEAATLIGLGGGEEAITKNMPPTMAERVKAAELLGKRYAMWTDKQVVEGVQQVVIHNDLDD